MTFAITSRLNLGLQLGRNGDASAGNGAGALGGTGEGTDGRGTAGFPQGRSQDTSADRNAPGLIDIDVGGGALDVSVLGLQVHLGSGPQIEVGIGLPPGLGLELGPEHGDRPDGDQDRDGPAANPDARARETRDTTAQTGAVRVSPSTGDEPAAPDGAAAALTQGPLSAAATLARFGSGSDAPGSGPGPGFPDAAGGSRLAPADPRGGRRAPADGGRGATNHAAAAPGSGGEAGRPVPPGDPVDAAARSAPAPTSVPALAAGLAAALHGVQAGVDAAGRQRIATHAAAARGLAEAGEADRAVSVARTQIPHLIAGGALGQNAMDAVAASPLSGAGQVSGAGSPTLQERQPGDRVPAGAAAVAPRAAPAVEAPATPRPAAVDLNAASVSSGAATGGPASPPERPNPAGDRSDQVPLPSRSDAIPPAGAASRSDQSAAQGAGPAAYAVPGAGTTSAPQVTAGQAAAASGASPAAALQAPGAVAGAGSAAVPGAASQTGIGAVPEGTSVAAPGAGPAVEGQPFPLFNPFLRRRDARRRRRRPYGLGSGLSSILYVLGWHGRGRRFTPHEDAALEDGPPPKPRTRHVRLADAWAALRDDPRRG